MPRFADILRLLETLKGEGVFADYAIAGAMAANFWDEAMATQDLDVIVIFGVEPPPLDPLRPIFDRLPAGDYPRSGEHIQIAGVPVQFLPAWSPLVAEAVKNAYEVTYDTADPDSPPLRILTPTYMAAIWQHNPSAMTARRRERLARFREAGLVDEVVLARLLER